MKKTLVIGLILILSLGMALALSGCGDKNKDTAKQYMQDGDGYYEEARVSWSDIEGKQAELGAKVVQKDYSAFTGEAGAALQKEIETALAEIVASLESAVDSYKKITDLEGVEDYKEYASKMIEAAETREGMVEAAKALINEMTAVFTALAQGQDVDFMSMLMGSENMKKLDELATEVVKLEKEAEKIKQEKKL